LDKSQFSRVLNALIFLFQDDKLLLETRGALIIRKLCALLDAKSIYVSFASILDDRVDLDFASVMVQTMNLILLTAPELISLRKSLKQCMETPKSGSDSSSETFITLFRSWCHNPVATFSLCLLAHAYDLSANLIMKFAEIDVSVGFLMQIDKLVQLLESPIFIHLRLELLEVSSKRHKDLLKSLYGLLMLLPQSQAYKTLSDRLSTVSSLQAHMGKGSSVSVAEQEKGQDSNQQLLLYDELLIRFENVQDRHSKFHAQLLFKKNSSGAS
jgi:vacuole morphology and inheritance protein 14